VPQLYHDLKMVAHVWFAVFLQVCVGLSSSAPLCCKAPHSRAGMRSTPAMTLGAKFPAEQLTAYRAAMVAANATITAQRFSDPGMLARQRRMMARAFRFVDDIVAAGQVDNATLVQYTKDVGNDTLANVDDAARARVDALHITLTQWRADKNILPPELWAGFRFITHSSHMANEGDLAAQYFARALSQDPANPDVLPNHPNTRVIYLDDGVISENLALADLGSHYTDYAGAEAMFGDKYRLHRDILADSTTAYLDKIFGKNGAEDKN
jgi:hypothetical protein